MSNYCINCKFFRRSWAIWPLDAELGECRAPENMVVDGVTGKLKGELPVVVLVRDFRCKGDWFEESWLSQKLQSFSGLMPPTHGGA